MRVKIIMTWNIKPGKEQAYFGFVISEFMPRASRLGMELTDAWATVYGDQPQILAGARMPDLDRARKLVNSEAWLQLIQELEEFVNDFKLKLVTPKGNFQF